MQALLPLGKVSPERVKVGPKRRVGAPTMQRPHACSLRVRLAEAAACGLGLGFAVGFGLACAPELDPRTCSDAIVGEPEDWQAEVPVATPECVGLPYAPPIGFCAEHEGGDHEALELDVRLDGTIVELGTGAPPADCAGMQATGSLFDPIDGALAVPPEDVRWIRIDVDGERWVLVMVAANDTAPLAVGDDVTAYVEWKIVPVWWRYRFDLRDADGEPLWWLADDIAFQPVEDTPGCQPVRLGEPACNSFFQCWQLQHHALEIGGATVAPHEQAVVDGLRFTNGASWFSYDASCTDVPYGERMIAATREG